MFFTSDCRQVRNLLWDIAAGKAVGSDYKHAEAHLARCESCRNELQSYRYTISLVGEYKRDAVPASRLGWRDVEKRVALQAASARGWAKRPLMQLVMGGGSLALATAFVMLVMQANMNPPGVHAPVKSPTSIAQNSTKDVVSGPDSINFPAISGMFATTEMPTVDDASISRLRTAPPSMVHGLLVRSGSLAPNLRKRSSAAKVAVTDGNTVNVDGESPGQSLHPLHPEYVLASASSGNDDDQNLGYVMDRVSTSRSSSASDGSEESHPW